MKLIVGLGNPGEEYAESRHNVGFMVLERLIERFRFGEQVHQKNAFTRKGKIAGRAVMVAWPQTFMNLSGDAVASLVRSNVESLQDLLVIYDDVDLELGRLRIRPNGSAGTHNGMRSIVEALGSEAFPRIRLGVRGDGYSETSLRDYVLDDFEPHELERVDQMIAMAADAVVMIARGDIRRAMNEFNRARREEEEQE